MASHARPRNGTNASAARTRRVRLLVLGAVAVVVAGVVIGIVATSGSSPTAAKKGSGSTSPAQVSSTVCPLTDLPAPGGTVPARPALLVKIGNEPEGARPQSGLNEADIVYDTPAEGFIMRYVAVFQCQNASSIGPVRSVRWVDSRIAEQLGNPILAFAGGIDPDVNAVMSAAWLHGADLLTGAQSAGTRISSRSAPDNLYTSTSALYGLFKSATKLPTAPFVFGSAALPASATPAASLSIDFSAGTDVVWKWDAAAGDWVHTYAGSTDVDTLDGKPVTTTNIVVEVVSYKIGPYCESNCPGGSGDIESNVIGNGSGYLLRDGKVLPVTWHRHNRIGPTTFTDAAGQVVGIAPGRTWVEIVPDTVAKQSGALTVTP